jgi:hypothetical protein
VRSEKERRAWGDEANGAIDRFPCRPITTHFSLLTSYFSLLTFLASQFSVLTAQVPTDLVAERQQFSRWLETAPLSPYAVLVLQPVGTGISIGYEPSDIPLPTKTRGIAREVGGVVSLELGDRRITLRRGHPVSLEGFQLVATGPPSRAVIAAYGAVRRFKPPAFYSYVPALTLTVTLRPPERRGTFRTLAPDGSESEATEVGIAEVAFGGIRAKLRVYRIGAANDEEAELLIFFRDSTNGHGSYPAGRFVPLVPVGQGKYLLDFNRARNPFCAYSSAFPCPAPWPGNTIPAAVPAGETYAPHDVEKRG